MGSCENKAFPDFGLAMSFFSLNLENYSLFFSSENSIAVSSTLASVIFSHSSTLPSFLVSTNVL